MCGMLIPFHRTKEIGSRGALRDQGQKGWAGFLLLLPDLDSKGSAMNTVLTATEQLHGLHSTVDFRLASEEPTILVASGDPGISDNMAKLLEPYPINTVWVKGSVDARVWLATDQVTACLCGFWLEDGSCRDLVKQAKRQAPATPVIIVSTPACMNEYREYLAAMNAGAFDFFCYPYRRLELERILRRAITTHLRGARQPSRG